MKNWKANLIALLAVILCCVFIQFLTSCGSIHKLKNRSKSKVDSTIVIKTNTITSETLTTTEKVDTSIVGKKDSLTVKTDLSKLEKGDTNKVNSGTIEVDTYFDKKENKIITSIKTTPPATHFFIDKKSTIIKNEHKIENKKTELKKQESHSNKQVDKKSNGFGIALGIMTPIYIILFLILLYFIFRKKIKEKFPIISKFLP